MIAASRGFVNVRMNVWLDDRNYERMQSLAGDRSGDGNNTQKTVFCLFEPDAPGLSADSFPAEPSIYFGTRPGNRIPACCTPARESSSPRSAERLAEIFEQRWMNDTGDREPDPDLIERIVWEFQSSKDGEGIARIMNELAALHPGRASVAQSVPRLPVMPDLPQALNFAAADSRAVLVLVHASEGDRVLEESLARLAFEQGIAGRAHVVRQTPSEWADARASGRIRGGSLRAGVVFVAPDPYGRDGDVQAEIPPDASLERLRTELTAALGQFHAGWRKLDRARHLQEGSRLRIHWAEYLPRPDCVVPFPIRGSQGTSPDEPGPSPDGW